MEDLFVQLFYLIVIVALFLWGSNRRPAESDEEQATRRRIEEQAARWRAAERDREDALAEAEHLAGLSDPDHWCSVCMQGLRSEQRSALDTTEL